MPKRDESQAPPDARALAMGMLRRPGDAVGVGSWIAVASLAACGGSVADRVAHDEAPVDASVVSIDDAEPKGNTAPPDALAPCSTTCSDGAAGPRDAAGAQDVAEASAVSSVPALVPSYNELCEVVWPQPDGVMAGEM